MLAVAVAPIARAKASGSSITSVTVISAAPAWRAAAAVSTPIGPAPVISTRAPASGPAWATACRQTASGSAKAAALTETPGPTGTAWVARQVSSSRNPPWTCGLRIALPRKRMSVQWLESPARHHSQTPQGRLGLTATRVPGAGPATPGPTASTVPAISWPRIIGSLSRTLPKPPCR